MLLLILAAIGSVGWKYFDIHDRKVDVALFEDKEPPRTIMPNTDSHPSSMIKPDGGAPISEKPMPPASYIDENSPQGILPTQEQHELNKPLSPMTEYEEINTDGSKKSSITNADMEPDNDEEGMAVLEDSSLKLMAIAWADDPKSRIAVINDRIVREGDVIEGMAISRINEDEVILRKGGNNWKLLFRLQ